MVAMHELIWQIKPYLTIEMGIAHGGFPILSTSMLSLFDCCDAIEQGGRYVGPESPRSSRARLGLSTFVHTTMRRLRRI